MLTVGFFTVAPQFRFKFVAGCWVWPGDKQHGPSKCSWSFKFQRGTAGFGLISAGSSNICSSVVAVVPLCPAFNVRFPSSFVLCVIRVGWCQLFSRQHARDFPTVTFLGFICMPAKSGATLDFSTVASISTSWVCPTSSPIAQHKPWGDHGRCLFLLPLQQQPCPSCVAEWSAEAVAEDIIQVFHMMGNSHLFFAFLLLIFS